MEKNMLDTILKYEAKEAEWGAKASEKRKEYAELYSKYKKGDIVRTVHNNKDYNATVTYVKFITSPCRFVYFLQRHKADGSLMHNCTGIRKYEEDILPA